MFFDYLPPQFLLTLPDLLSLPHPQTYFLKQNKNVNYNLRCPYTPEITLIMLKKLGEFLGFCLFV